MARDRFSDLNRIYTALKQGKVDMATLPPNLDFVRYGKWKEGNGPERTIIRPDTQGEKQVGVIAFGLPGTDDNSKIIVTMTLRSFSFLDDKAPTLGVIDGDTVTGPAPTYAVNGSFVPAKASIGVIATGTSATSAITGRKYKKTINNSYSSPFGQTSSKKYYQEQVSAVIAAYTPAEGKPTHRLSFQPEQWRRD